MTASLGLSVCNIGEIKQQSRGCTPAVYTSHIVIAFVTERSSHLVRDWKTHDQYSASLHRYITFCVSGATQRDPVLAEERWLWRRYDKPSPLKFIVSAETVTVDDALSATRSLDRYLKDACDNYMPKGTYKKIKKLAYWWTQEISNMREVCKRTRRKYKKGRHRPIEKHQ